MENQNKDVTLIIKGWYNKKYKNSFEALTAYYHKYYRCDDFEPTKEFICMLFFAPIIKEHLKNGSNINSFIDSLVNNGRNPLINNKSLYDLFMQYISLLNREQLNIDMPEKGFEVI